MNQYHIRYTYPALDGSPAFTDFTNITERSEAAACKDFKSHHKDGTILDIELVAENVSATKQQERDTLEVIRKMVAELGPDSYIATAFEGCFEIAEQNIEYDFADSMAGRLEVEREKAAHAAGMADEACKALLAEKENVASFEEELETVREKLDTARKNAETLNQWLTEQKEATAAERQRADAAQETITQLKAKLYDMLTA